jgi:hypothetical protein
VLSSRKNYCPDNQLFVNFINIPVTFSSEIRINIPKAFICERVGNRQVSDPFFFNRYQGYGEPSRILMKLDL